MDHLCEESFWGNQKIFTFFLLEHKDLSYIIDIFPADDPAIQEAQTSWNIVTFASDGLRWSLDNLLVDPKTLGPIDAIWWHRIGSILAPIMANCLMAPSHYLNQCWLIISDSLWHSPNVFSQEIIWVWNYLLHPPHNKVVVGYTDFSPSVHPSVHPSVDLSVHPSHIPCPLCSTYSSGWFHFILYILSSNSRRCVSCKVSCKISKFEFLAILF